MSGESSLGNVLFSARNFPDSIRQRERERGQAVLSLFSLDSWTEETPFTMKRPILKHVSIDEQA